MKNYSDKSLKTFEIRLQPASKKPDLTCADGEIESYRNVEWLKALEETQDKNSSASNSSKAENPTIMDISLRPTGIELPYGSRLLAVHSPDALHGECRYLVLTTQDSLAIYAPGTGLSYLPGLASNMFGEIYKAVVYADFILILSSKGIGWIVFNPSDSSYTLTTGTLYPPNIAYSLIPAALTGYSSVAGEWPELNIALDIPPDSGSSQVDFQNWLDLGINNSVSEDVRRRVYHAVGQAVKKYAQTVSHRGLFLLPPVCIAAFDNGILPSQPLRAAATANLSYSPPCARLTSWSFQSDILRLRVTLSLIPLTLTASYSLPAEMEILARRFRKISIAAAIPDSWTADGDLGSPAIAYTAYTDPSTGAKSGFAFRFNSLTPEELEAYTSANLDFRVIREISLRQYSTGTTTLRHPDFFPSSSSVKFSPDYRDFSIPTPRDAIATDTGFVLFSGEAKLYDKEGFYAVRSLDSSILASLAGYPFIFRHHCRVSDGSVLSVTISGRARTSASSGRHPLYVISSDGNRQLSSDAEGGYLNSRLISSVAPLRSFPIATNTDPIFYATADDIRSLSPSGTLTIYPIAPPEGNWKWMIANSENDALLLYAEENPVIIDLRQNKLFPINPVMIKEPVVFESRILTKHSAATLMHLLITRSEEISDTEPQMAEQSLLRSQMAEQSETNTAVIVTRPLKFGSTSMKKRIRAISAAHPAISISIEGSDNLKDWESLLSTLPDLSGIYPAGIRALRLPAFRFFRLKAETYIPLAPNLASFTFTIES